MGRINDDQIIATQIKYHYLSIPAIYLVGMFFCLGSASCENDLESVKTVTATDSTPDEIVNNMHTLYSDSGIVKFEIIATRMEKFNGENETTLFKDGFEVNFFKGENEIEAKLTAEYGEMRKNEKTIVARNNVIFINYIEDQTLRTEELTWYQTTKRIKTNKQFQLWDRKENYYALGSDMESDETFRDYILHNVSVEHEIK